jgi:hypothetical protein
LRYQLPRHNGWLMWTSTEWLHDRHSLQRLLWQPESGLHLQ